MTDSLNLGPGGDWASMIEGTRIKVRVPEETILDCAVALWDMLDEIDTCLDAFHPEASLFVEAVTRIVANRFDHAVPDHDALIWKHS